MLKKTDTKIPSGHLFRFSNRSTGTVCFTHCSDVSIDDFEQVDASWIASAVIILLDFIVDFKKKIGK